MREVLDNVAETGAEGEALSLRVTIRDVAQRAGVSVATASKALNERGRMTAETRERVQAAARALDFRPNAMARALVHQRSFTLGLLTSDIYGRFTLPVAAGLSQAMEDRGVSVFLSVIEEGRDDPRRSLEAMQEKCVDGLVLAGRRVDRALPLDLAGLRMPVVHVYTQVPDGGIGFQPDDAAGARLAIAHLLSLGRRRIAHVTGPESFAAVTMRRDGWLSALAEAGLPPFGAALSGEWSEAYGYLAGQRLFGAGATGERPDAVFCGSDQIARGLLDALIGLSVGVPDEVAVVSFDNWEILAGASRPPLTSVDMELKELGRQAGLTLLDLIDGVPVERGVRRLPCRLAVRRSCGAGAETPAALPIDRLENKGGGRTTRVQP